MEGTQYSICIFTTLALLFLIFFSNSIKKNSKKHIIAAMFIMSAAFIHALTIMLMTYSRI
jgi:hypothetical protein